VKISCPACAAKYSIADEKVSDRLAKIRCRKCNATIVIDGKANPPSVYTAAGEATTEASDDAGDSQAAGLQFTVDFGEGDQRTMAVSEIVAAYNAGQITQDTYLWADGFADWKPLAEVEEVVAALSSGAPAPAAAPWASAAASPARTAARTAARAPAPDLFGGIDAAGGEEDVATSAPEHAGGASRGGGGGLGLSSAGSSGGSGTGARNESSVLFSLSALTSAASRPSSRPVAPAITAPSGSATREDSGLIDLKALTAAATKSEAQAAAPLTAAPLISPLAAPPLGIASPLGGGLGLGGASAIDYGPPQAKNKTGLYIGGGIAVAAIAAVAIVFMLRPAPPPPAPPPVAAAPAPTPPPAPTPAPTPEVTATPPSTGVAAAEEAPKGKPAIGKRPTGGGAVKKPTGGAASPAPASEPAAAPKPKRNPCGCAPGDLQCAMRCAAG
jgi:predicted Zn finger-like uncharacterized protein